MQLYSEEKSSGYRKQPKKETIKFLLDFSKSLKIVKSEEERTYEFTLN